MILCHYVGPLSQSSNAWFRLLGMVSNVGWVGVDLFFVLSGFLIGGILLDSAAKPEYFKPFYVRRFVRIVPAYLLVLGTFGYYYRAEILPWYSYATFTQNLFMGLTATWPVLSQLWSLAVEEQFYLLLPPLIRQWSKAVPMIAVSIIALSPAIRVFEFHGHGWNGARFLPFGRLDGLFIGVLIAYYRPQLSALIPHIKTVAVLSGSALAYFGYRVWLDREVQVAVAGYSLLAVFFGSVMALTLILRPRALRFEPFAAFGQISYGLYLFHLPVLIFVGERLAGVNYLAQSAISLALSFAICTASWKLLESPLIHLGRTALTSQTYMTRPMPQPH